MGKIESEHADARPGLDPLVMTVIERARAESQPASEVAARVSSGSVLDPFELVDYALPVSPEQGAFMYLLCRAIGARVVVECATSHGISTLYLAAAVRDNGGGIVIGSELVEAKAERARRNLESAGLGQLAEIRVGDGAVTLADLDRTIDFLLIDAWPGGTPTLGRAIIELVTPRLRHAAIVVNDNGEKDYLDYVRDPSHGFMTMSLPFKGSTELSMRI